MTQLHPVSMLCAHLNRCPIMITCTVPGVHKAFPQSLFNLEASSFLIALSASAWASPGSDGSYELIQYSTGEEGTLLPSAQVAVWGGSPPGSCARPML